jgi:hypothetical protein
MTIREFVHELEWHKITLQGSTELLTEQDLRQQLLSSLPNDLKWQNAKDW